MSTTLEKIYYIAMRKYNMELIAGHDGIYSNVSWLHIVEQIKFASFLTGEELVLYTGMKQDCSLLDFIKEIKKYKASGIVVNIGEYISVIPDEVIEYANENAFPVFTLPWEVHLVELSREFGSMIIRNEEDDKSLCSAFKSSILNYEDKESYVPYMQKNKFWDKRYSLIKCLIEFGKALENADSTKITYELRAIFESVLNRYRENFVIFRHDRYLTMIIPEGQRDECEKILLQINTILAKKRIDVNLYFAVGRFNLWIDELHREYNNLSKVCNIARKKLNKHICYIEDLGSLNVLFAVEDFKSLLKYQKASIGKLEEYDVENGTNYMGILKAYLENDCNMNIAAKKFFLHRNTFAYHLNKISELLGADLYSMEIRADLLLAIKIKELAEL